MGVPVVHWHEGLLEGQSSEVAFNPFLTGQDFIESREGTEGVGYRDRDRDRFGAPGEYQSSAAKEQMVMCCAVLYRAVLFCAVVCCSVLWCVV